MYKESVAAPIPYVRSIAGFGADFMKILLRNCKNRTHKKYAPCTGSSARGAKNKSCF